RATVCSIELRKGGEQRFRLAPILTDAEADIIRTRVPRSNPHSLTFLLLAAMIVVPLAGQDGSMVMVPARPAACHQHEGALPSPQPVSYHCCQSGHDSAILQSSSASRPDSPDLATPFERSDIFASPAMLPIVGQVAASSADPPKLTPLRI
ncbi:MAG: hypothetical protein ACRD3W_31175, partial [Terriglobales bacterium]